MMKKFLLALAVSIAPMAASALTVQTVATNANAWNAVNPANSLTLPNGGSWTSAPVQMPNAGFPQVNPCISFCSPFDPGIFGTTGNIGATPLANWDQIPFWATWQAPAGSNTNVLSFSRAQSSFSMLWGSMDIGNVLEFVLNGVVVGSINGGNLPGVTVGNPGQGAALVRIFNLAYDQVRFSSTNGGFEYANVTASPVPLPLPIAGLLAGLGALGLVKRRRRTA